MKKKIILFISMISLFLGNFNHVYAEEIYPGITDEILNNYSTNIDYMNGNISVIKGKLNTNLLVNDILSSIDMDSLNTIYGVTNISIIYKTGDNALANDTVTSGMKLLFTLTDNSTISYDILVIGDINCDGVVNESDVSSMVSNILGYGTATYINDLNKDGLFNILDITNLLHSITTNSWENNTTANDYLYSEMSSKSNIYVGDEVEVKYTIKGFKLDSINGIEGILNYDTNLLELTNISINSTYGDIRDDGKFIYILNNYTGSDALITLTFKTKGSGNALVSIQDITASINGISANLDSKSITQNIQITENGKGGDGSINNPSEAPKPTSKTPTTPKTNPTNSSNNGKTHQSYSIKLLPTYLTKNIERESVTYIKLSSNNYIDSLNIKNYPIAFNKDTLEYFIEVANDVNSLDLDIILGSNLATYRVIGNENFKVGKNIVQIETIAEDGSTRTYVLNVTKKDNQTTKEKEEKKEKNSNSSRIVIIILIILIIIGLIYIIFKDDEEEEREKLDKKE